MTTITTIKTTTLHLLRRLADADWGHALEIAGRGLAIAIAFTYATGWLLGTWVHQSASLLARFARELSQDDWHQQRLSELRTRLQAQAIVLEPLPPAEAPEPAAEPVQRSKRSKLPQPAPKPSRQRRPRNAKRTTAPATAAA